MAEPRISFDEARAQSLSKWAEILEKAYTLSDLISTACGFCRRWEATSGARACEGCEAYDLCHRDGSLYNVASAHANELITVSRKLLRAISELEPPEGEEG